jgi:hypothetical protein
MIDITPSQYLFDVDTFNRHDLYLALYLKKVLFIVAMVMVGQAVMTPS